ncbi:MAG: phage major capsid protein [Methyloligellaceae bacterium]
MASANSSFSEVVTTTLKNRRRRLADNVLNHNALLRMLNERGMVDTADGGETLVEELEFAENATFKYYSGYEILDISPSDVFSAAEFNWKQAAVVVTIDGLTQRKNSGRERMIRLLESRIRNAEKSMMNNISTGVYSDGTGTSGKQIGGLQQLVADAPTTGTVGGINRANFSFWQNNVFDASSDGGSAASSGVIQGYMNSLWLEVLRGSDKPNIIVADSVYYSAYWESLQNIQRITEVESAGSGFRSTTFYGPGGSAPVFYDDQCPASHLYMLNTDYLHWRPHRDANMEPLMARESLNQDAIVRPIIFMGNLTASNCARQGVLKA